MSHTREEEEGEAEENWLFIVQLPLRKSSSEFQFMDSILCAIIMCTCSWCLITLFDFVFILFLCRKQMSTITQRMTASREARKRQNMMATRVFSPLSPGIQRVYGGKEGNAFQFPPKPHRSAPKVKFSSKVTEFPDHSAEVDRHEESGLRQSSKMHSSTHPTSSTHSPSHVPASGHVARSPEYANVGMRSSEHGNVGMRPSEHTSLGVKASEHGNIGTRSIQGLRLQEHGKKGARTSEHLDRSMPDGESGYSKHPPTETAQTHSRKQTE